MKIGIVGAGQVGATAAYSMMMRRVGSEITLVDRNADLAVAQARDILDATPFADPVRVRAGESVDLAGARVAVLAAGTNQKPGESRLDLLSRNAEIFAEIVPAVLAATSDPIFLVATNPVDVMTEIVAAIAGRSGVPPQRVIGSGKILNSARFRTQLAVHLGISPDIYRCASAWRTRRQRGAALVGRDGGQLVGRRNGPPGGAWSDRR